MFRSIRTVKADLAQAEHGLTGEGVVLAVVGTGVDATHPHFKTFANLDLPSGLHHIDFSTLTQEDVGSMYGVDPNEDEILAKILGRDDIRTARPVDVLGQSTRVAGVIAGQGTLEFNEPQSIRGIAPATRILSINIMNRDGSLFESELKAILALRAIQFINVQHGAPVIHGVVLPLSFPWDARNYACGHTPICSEVDRAVNSGVAVFTVAGNSGFDEKRGAVVEGGITDPGNSELAITVGSTHRTLPEVYGASFFSCRGPTADGRQKPDLLAPGERIYSPAATVARTVKGGKKGRRPKIDLQQPSSLYEESEGTSLSAAHVAGAAAGLMSLRRNLIGKPGDLKEILLRTAVDLRRLPTYQGAGLLDVQAAARDALGVTGRVIQSSVPPVRVFCSYSHKDVALFKEFDAHLTSMKRGAIQFWSDALIEGGARWRQEIYDALEAADIIILLVSAYFFESEFISSIELKRALEREAAGATKIVPVRVRPASLRGTVVGEIQPLPPGGKPITLYPDPHQGWAEVVEGLWTILEQLKK